MIFKNDLTVLHDDDGTFADYSKEAADYGRDSFVLPLVAADDYLYIGLYKPFNQLFIEMKVINAIAATLTAEFFDGSTWNNLDNFLDQSNAFARSGFMKWEKNEDWAKTTINGDELYWVRFKPSVDVTGTMEIQGLNILFADDQDLANVFTSIQAVKGSSLTSFVTYHQNARDDIIQSLRNKGNSTKDSAKFNSLKSINKWDLLDASELKMGAIYAALSSIFFEISDDVDDKWYQRHKDYGKKAKESLELFYLSIDTNDDGKETANETMSSQGVSLTRV